MVLGKPIAGGIPAAVYGFTHDVTDRIRKFLETRTPGHSGIGTTLSGSKIQLALMRAVLENYFTEEAFGPLVALAKRLLGDKKSAGGEPRVVLLDDVGRPRFGVRLDEPLWTAEVDRLLALGGE
jgi:hypothetical protein